MEATINVKVSLEEATLQKIAQLLGGRPAGVEARPAAGHRPAVPERLDGTKSGAQVGAKSDPTPEPAKAEVSVVQLNGAVVNAMGRGVSQDTLKALLAQEGLSKFSECPADKRSALLDKVNAL